MTSFLFPQSFILSFFSLFLQSTPCISMWFGFDLLDALERKSVPFFQNKEEKQKEREVKKKKGERKQKTFSFFSPFSFD